MRHKAVEEEFSSVALSDAGKALFVASDTGMIKALKLPLTGEVVGQAVKAHAMMQGSSNYCVPRMCVGDLGSLLVSAGHDGCVVVFGVTRDKDAKAVERGRDGMPLAEEVLVTKTDLEEKQRQMRELEQKVLDNQSKYEWEMNLVSGS